MAGASVRYWLSRLVTTDAGTFPWDTFAENVVGAFLLGLVLVELVRRFPNHRYLRPFLAIGFLGSFTTFSALAVEADLLIRDGRLGLAGGYWLASVVSGLLAAWAGIAVARGSHPHAGGQAG
jgi:fluoride exporter